MHFVCTDQRPNKTDSSKATLAKVVGFEFIAPGLLRRFPRFPWYVNPE